jgi:hypothetical protein
MYTTVQVDILKSSTGVACGYRYIYIQLLLIQVGARESDDGGERTPHCVHPFQLIARNSRGWENETAVSIAQSQSQSAFGWKEGDS